MKLSRDIRLGDAVTAISLWEPWAKLMATGAKRVETRHWATNYRGPLLICAAARKHKGELAALYQEPAFRRALGYWPGIDVLMGTLYHGHAVAMVDLYDIRSTDARSDALMGAYNREDERHFGNYEPGRYGWLTRGLRRIVPFRQRGAQGLFTVTMPDFEDWRVDD